MLCYKEKVPGIASHINRQRWAVAIGFSIRPSVSKSLSPSYRLRVWRDAHRMEVASLPARLPCLCPVILQPNSNQVNLQWQGGSGNYQLQKLSASNTWQDLGASLMGNAASVSIDSSSAIVRVRNVGP